MKQTQMSELSVEEAITHIKAACKIAINAGYNSVGVDACAMAVEALRSSASPTGAEGSEKDEGDG